MGFLTSKGKREEEQMREHGCEWGGVWGHKQTHRETQSVLAEYVCFFSRSFFFFSFFVEGVCAATVLHLAASGPV